MESFKFNPEQIKSKRLGFHEEGEKLKPEQALVQERGILKHFKGKANRVAGVLLLVSAFSAGPYMANETYAQENNSNIRTEKIQKQEEQVEKINRANLTESSKWSQDILDSARADIGKIKTSEDAEWLVRTYFNQLVSEYYMPTGNNLSDGPYGIKIRNYTEDDSKLLLRNAQEMKKIMQELNTKFGIEAFSERMEQADDMIEKLERQSSYSGQKQKEALEKIEKLLQ